MITAQQARKMTDASARANLDKLFSDHIGPKIQVNAGLGKDFLRVTGGDLVREDMVEFIRSLEFSCVIRAEPSDGPTRPGYEYLLIEW